MSVINFPRAGVERTWQPAVSRKHDQGVRPGAEARRQAGGHHGPLGSMRRGSETGKVLLRRVLPPSPSDPVGRDTGAASARQDVATGRAAR